MRAGGRHSIPFRLCRRHLCERLSERHGQHRTRRLVLDLENPVGSVFPVRTAFGDELPGLLGRSPSHRRQVGEVDANLVVHEGVVIEKVEEEFGHPSLRT